MGLRKWTTPRISASVLALSFSAVIVGQAAANSATLHNFVAGAPQGCNITSKVPYPPELPPCKAPEEHDLAVMLGTTSASGVGPYVAFNATVPNTVLDGVEYVARPATTPGELYVVDGRIFIRGADEAWLPDDPKK